MPDWSGFECGNTKVIRRVGAAPDGVTKRALYIATNKETQQIIFIRSNQIAPKCRRYIQSAFQDRSPAVIKRFDKRKADYYTADKMFSRFKDARVMPMYQCNNIISNLKKDWTEYTFEIIGVE